MPEPKLSDILLRMSDNKDEFLKELRDTKDSLSSRLGKVEQNLAGISANVHNQGREIEEVKTELRNHINTDGRDHTKTFAVPPTLMPEPSPLSTSLKHYAALGAFVSGIALTILNMLGVF